LRIAVFSESFEPVINGVSVSISLLAGRLEELGHEVFCFAPRYPGHTDSSPRVFRFPSVRAPGVPDYPLALPWSGGLFRVFRELAPDVVHTHTPFALGVRGQRWAARLGIPLVSTNHTLYTEYVHYIRPVPPALMRALAVWWMRRYYNRCSHVIVPSAATGRRLESYGVRTPWTAIPTGISFPEPPAGLDGRAVAGASPDDRLLLYLGRIAREKNLDLLLEAFRILLQKEPSARLVVVGGGPYLQRCRERAAALGVDGRVTFTGPLPRDVLPAVFSAAELFLFPSTTETQGLVVGEAALHGLPCVAVDAGGTPEFVRHGETGLLVRPDPEEFASAALQLLSDGDRREAFSRAARDLASALTVDGMARRVLEVYRSAAAGRPLDDPVKAGIS
jgi:1,2-diacylglycerol 3-alpha-glucosyltransferase